jgi:hypothetical protein
MNESRCNCDWATGECQGPVGCQAVNSLPALVKALEDCIDILDGAQSGFISGSGSDIAWHQGREQRIEDARSALAAYRGSSK